MNAKDIKKVRIRLGLSQEEFGRRLGVRFETINRWENGHFKPSPLAEREIQRLLDQMKDGDAK